METWNGIDERGVHRKGFWDHPVRDPDSVELDYIELGRSVTARLWLEGAITSRGDARDLVRMWNR